MENRNRDITLVESAFTKPVSNLCGMTCKISIKMKSTKLEYSRQMWRERQYIVYYSNGDVTARLDLGSQSKSFSRVM